jgi:hypothetical protein
MGLFSRKGAPTKPGSYKTAWPRESGLGIGPYPLEADAQEAYLLYTSQRRESEPVPEVDREMMRDAEALICTLAGGDPPNERPLIQGPMDVQWFAPTQSEEYEAQVLITDRRLIVWWRTMRGMQGNLIVLDHVGMVPRADTSFRHPFQWIAGYRTDFPLSSMPRVTQFQPAAATIGAHFSSAGHANRRAMSVHKTLLHLEEKVRTTQLDESFRL